ncbi:hypothetical protein JCM19233_140 [Vibrio astriarenae]|nr:hypothetical protein JCM19233_140 [Vibrio sp. C7]
MLEVAAHAGADIKPSRDSKVSAAAFIDSSMARQGQPL